LIGAGDPAYDLFGERHGFRRPGTEMFVEPGISYTHGQHAISFNVPFGYYYNRHPNPITDNPGDVTSPRQIFLTSYSLRFGRQHHQSAGRALQKQRLRIREFPSEHPVWLASSDGHAHWTRHRVLR
jgi:hypothetical protein